MAVYTFFFLISLSTRNSILASDKICSGTYTVNKDDCAKARTFIPYTGPADNQVFDSKDVEKGKSGTCRISVSSNGDAAKYVSKYVCKWKQEVNISSSTPMQSALLPLRKT
ncbi:hypothetical protein PGTUg99_030964 [Puccinia graminis f. sp. tritici]|uniref:Secreted protein n=1 Tax=Puccinia graminis f. sp. tritici TaxID=56615 RepID=A0A5B0NHW0_PUCGR|nr:hypothetical protein PGTUg99_030964 [Puccinia graminis f. sp. tritici]